MVDSNNLNRADSKKLSCSQGNKCKVVASNQVNKSSQLIYHVIVDSSLINTLGRLEVKIYLIPMKKKLNPDSNPPPNGDTTQRCLSA
jgi:hypothetical protein